MMTITYIPVDFPALVWFVSFTEEGNFMLQFHAAE